MRVRTFLSIVTVLATLATAAPGTADVCVEVNQIGTVAGFCVPTDQGPGQDPCIPRQDRGQGGGGPAEPLCMPGPASCVAVGVVVEVDPKPGLPTGATTQLSRSAARAGSFGQFSFAQAQADAEQVSTELPGALSAGVIESWCYAETASFFDQPYDFAAGNADASGFSLDLGPNYGIALSLAFDVLCEQGGSVNTAGLLIDASPFACAPPPAYPGPSATGGNRADIANVIVNGVPVASLFAAPNTHIPLPPVSGLVGDLYLNEQNVSRYYGDECPTYWGNALRLRLRVPAGGIATVTIGHVATTTCFFIF